MFEWAKLDAMQQMSLGPTNQEPRDNYLLVVEKDPWWLWKSSVARRLVCLSFLL